jgi:hypothetical protein
MDLRLRVMRKRVALCAAAFAIVAVVTAATPLWAAPEVFTKQKCEATGGAFNVAAGIRFCTVVESYDTEAGPFAGTLQLVDGPTPGTFWSYNGYYVIVTSFERTTVRSQTGTQPIRTSTTVVQTGQSIQGADCSRRLRTFDGIALGEEELDRPLEECVAAGVYPAA